MQTRILIGQPPGLPMVAVIPNDRGFECLLVEDGCAAGTEEGHKAAVESVLGEGGIFGCVAGVEDVEQGLMRWKGEEGS